MVRAEKIIGQTLTIRHVGDETIYPEGIWHETRRFLDARSKLHLKMTDEFRAEALTSIIPSEASRWALPLSFSVFDVVQSEHEHAPEWKKMQQINIQRPNLNFFQPWAPFVIYEAHRRGRINILSTEEGSENTFYVQKGIAPHAFDIKFDRGYFGNKSDWKINCRGIGDHQDSPDHQRIFVSC